jgi:hypothetical protein
MARRNDGLRRSALPGLRHLRETRRKGKVPLFLLCPIVASRACTQRQWKGLRKESRRLRW